MKRKNLIFQVVSLFAIVGLIAVGCQKNDSPEAVTKKFTLGFDVQQPDVSAKKAIDDEDIPQYYGSACEWENAQSVVVGYTVNVKTPEGGVGEELVTGEAKLNILEWFSGGGVATELLQVEFTDDEATTAVMTVTKFVVMDGKDGTGDAIMATPVEKSAFDGYVEDPLNVTVDMEQFAKERKLVEVLCFQPDDYLEFGFTWFDFDIVVGNEYCAFFNCIDKETEDPSKYHAVADINFDVYEIDGNKTPLLYYSGNTKDVINEKAPSSCIPVPGSYYAAVDKKPSDAYEGDDTVVMEIRINGGPTIGVTVGDISSYNFGKFTKGLAEVPTFDWIKAKDYAGKDYKYEIVGNGNGENIAHYELNVCK